ncbi:succinyldiaminopimelate desuccinylase [Arboricoccus pini]|uniref:Succinyl-diaminopimelate desuccinylase n=1 Tax=Arboricoccus pini TaxID=1963835 RepID=A0A212QXD7_9PROT|nr:succinyl-diaminopimelate desuccinylase [Arboricoccus pini]SNB64395.1 succinyldiaminopimelate desuccinylase [Arboricoccus pini]
MGDAPSALDPVRLTQDLVRIPSVTPKVGACFDLLEEVLRPLGFEVERVSFAGPGAEPVENMLATLGEPGSNGLHLAFAGHVDVVPPGDVKAWGQDPFAGTIVNGRLFGRGAADMKSGVAAFVAAVANWRETTHPLPGKISLLLTGDEEGPAVDGTVKLLEWATARGHRFDACVVGEPTSQSELGDMMKIGRRGSLTGRLSVYGRQGHVGYPHRADNAAHRLVAMLASLLAQPLDAGNAFFEPSSLQVTTIDIGNAATNVVPGLARAVFNIRHNDLHNARSLEVWVRDRLDAVGGRYDLELKSSGDAFLTSPGPLSETLAAAVGEVTGRTPVLSTSGGTSDARFICHYCPVVELGLPGPSMHQVDEHVALEDITGLARIYEVFLRRYFARS